MQRLCTLDSITQSLFKAILRSVGRNPMEGKRKEGIKDHILIRVVENVPCLILFSEAVRHDILFLEEVQTLASGSIITFDYIELLFKKIKQNFPLNYFLGKMVWVYVQRWFRSSLLSYV